MMKLAVVQIEQQPARAFASSACEQAWLVQVTVAQVTGLEMKDICATTRSPPKVALARQVAMYLCHIVFNASLVDVAKAFGRDSSTVMYALSRIEELREEPEFDRTLDWLEAMLCHARRNA